MSAIFRTVAWQAGQLVSSVERGVIQLPDLQRPFVWPATKVRDLLDSMFRGYPVGALMFWDVSATGETRAIGTGTDHAAAHQIIDGQQRLPSLYAALRGQTVLDEKYRRKEITIAFNPFSSRFEVRTPALARSAEWLEDISTVFDSPLAAHRAFTRRYRESGRELTEEEGDRIFDVFNRLDGLKGYLFDVVHIQSDTEKRTVADIFVRINSEGVRLKSYDYILTWLSVFWRDGRTEIEQFARNSRLAPAHASEVSGKPVTWTPKNPYIELDTGHIVRAMVAIGQNRAKLVDAYNALQAKTRSSGMVDPERQEHELQLLKSAAPIVMDPLHWQEFIRSVQTAGFRSRKGITSDTNLISTYIFFLLGRTRYGVDLGRLRVLTARWLFMSQLTSRYTGSSESQLQRDLDRFSILDRGDSGGFERIADEVIATELTNDFWEHRIPDLLVTSGAALSPVYQCYLAALNILDADVFMLRMSVREWMDPSIPAVKGVEGHHLFPRKYQENVLGISDLKRINQAANFAPTDWDTNIFISDRPPAEYWPDLVQERGGDEQWLAQQMYWHALPEGWETLDYDEFLRIRRRLLSRVIRDAFSRLSEGKGVDERLLTVEGAEDVEPATLSQLLETSLLREGDMLAPADPSWEIDAEITQDGNLVINGTDEFDSLDEAASYLGVNNVSGVEFWALVTDEGLVLLGDLVRSPELARRKSVVN